MGKDIYSQLLDGGCPAPLWRPLHRATSDMGTLLSHFCFRRGVPIIILGQHGSDCIHTSRDRFSKAGKTILDPSRRSSIPCRAYQPQLLIRPAGTEECMYYPRV